jgi:hypothetical protein
VPAECWGCAIGIARVGALSSDHLLDPLGVCWDCHVFGCRGHGERDAGAGKWLCSASVAKALAASAGLPDPAPPAIHLADSEDFERRFGGLASASKNDREYWRSGPGEGTLASYLERSYLRESTRWDLLGDALGVGTFLLKRPVHEARWRLDVAGGPAASQVLPPALVEILNEAQNG